MASGNDEQIEYWNGNAGQNWVAMQERMDRLLAPLSDHATAAAAVASGEHVLDVGCGCGGTSIALADAGARVTGVDISAPMLARARARASGRDDLRFIEQDAAAHPWQPEHDVLFSRFGVMFFADPVAAFTNLRGALKPGGRVCFLCWQSPAVNPWISVAGRAAQPYLPQPAQAPDPHAPGPFAFADDARVRSILADAGFVEVTTTPVSAPMRVADSVQEALDFFLDIGPTRAALATIEPADRDAALAAIRTALEPHCGPDGVVLDGNGWVVQGRNP